MFGSKKRDLDPRPSSFFILCKTPVLGLAFSVLLATSPMSVFAFGTDQFRPDGRYSVAAAEYVSSVEPVQGSFSFSIPLVVPPGRLQMTPKLALQYNSQNESNISPFGYGWSVDIPYIERINRSGVNNLYSDYAFYSTLDGEIASSSQSTSTPISYRSKTDSGSFRAYSLNADGSWEVTGPDGLVYKFGTTTSSRMYDPGNNTHVFRWMLDEVRDTNGNYIKYEYYRNGNILYPDRVVYTGNNTTDGPFDIAFTRSARTDIATSTAPGFALVSNYLVTEIQARINGSWVRKYTLAYTAGVNGRRSVLSSVTEAGQGDSGTVTLPATLFTYSASTTSWTDNETWNAPARFSNGSDLGVRLGDVNGDGLVDFVVGYDATGAPDVREVYINDGSGWNLDAAWSVPVLFSNGVADQGARLVDVNGDGYADIVNAKEPTKEVYLNNATTSGWTLAISTIWQFPEYLTNGTGDFGVRIVDLNGDGLPDVVRHFVSSPSVYKVYLNNGSTWIENVNWSPPGNISWDGNDRGPVFADVNGDGLADFLTGYTYGETSTREAYLNNGDGTWAHNPSFDPPGGFTDANYRDTSQRVVDMNGDGLPDIVTSVNSSGINKDTWINNGNGFILDAAWDVPDVILWGYIDNGARFADVNGDGGVEMIMAEDVAGSATTVTYFNASKRTDLLVKVQTALGETRTISYSTPQQQFSGGSLENPKFPFILPITSSVTSNDGFGVVATTTYTYEGGAFYFNTPLDRKIAGFSTVTETDPLGSITKSFFHQGNTTDTGNGEYSDSIAKLGRPYRIEKRDGSSNIFELSINKWDEVVTTNMNKFVKLIQTLTLAYDGDSDHKDKAESYTFDNSSGHLLQKKQWGEVTGASNGTFTDVTGDTITTDFTYATSTATSTKPLSSETVYNNSSTKVQETKYYFDNLAFGTANKGNPTKIENWISGSSYASSTKVYNSFGLVTQERDPRAKLTTHVYDSINLYVATTTNPLSHTTQYYYDYSLGKPKQTIDSNGRVFETTYDGIDRVTAEKQPDIASPGTTITKMVYSYTDALGQRKVVETHHLDGSTDFTIYKYLDGLDRTIQTRKEAEVGSEFSVKDFVYNKIGLLQKESLPYFSSGSASTTPTADNALYTTYTYDPLRRVANVATAVGNTGTVYDQWVSTVTDALGNFKDFSHDAFGGLKEVVEHDNGSNYTTQYAYTAVGDLAQVTDSDANVRSFTYDGLGRRLTAQDLHDSGDATFGIWSYTYDLRGNLASTTDPKGQMVNYAYDDINRILSEDFTGVGGVEAEYGYDTCAEGIGRLCAATSTGATTVFAYNALGLPLSETRTIGGSVYATFYSYNRQASPTSIVYPDTSEVLYTYNTAGLLESVTQKEGGESFSAVISDFDYGPHEKPTFKKFGNGATTTLTYDSNALYRLTNIFTPIATSTGGGGGLGFLNGAYNNFAFADALPLAFLRFPTFFNVVLADELDPTTEESADAEPPIQDLPTLEPDASSTSAEIRTLEDTSSTTTSEVAQEGSADEVTSTPEFSQSTTTEPVFEVASTTESVFETATTTEMLLLASSTPITLPTIRAQLAKKNIKERATIKGHAIADAARSKKGEQVSRGNYTIELVDIEPIEGGVQAFVRAWVPDGTQIGFGTDGTVEIERFQIFNPPILVSDEDGDIIQEWEEKDPTTGETVLKKRMLREDPQEALLQVIEHNLSVMKGIHGPGRLEPGKIGRTVSTFFPDPDSETTSVDGCISTTDSGPRTWSDAHDDSTGDFANDSSTSVNCGHGSSVGIHQYTGGSVFSITRAFLLFDTSPIDNSATVGSTTLSVYGNAKANNKSGSLAVITTSPASNTALVNNDIDNVGTTTQSSSVTISSFSTSAYNSFDLNAAGISNVSITGVSKFGIREAMYDIPNNAPSGGGDAHTFVTFYAADTTGTTQDPKLVVEHVSPNNTPTTPTSLLAEGQSNPTGISDATPEFSALYNDPDTDDVATHYQIQVSTTSMFANIYWDSTKTSLASSTPQGTRIADVSYSGTALASSTTYYWRIRFWDVASSTGAWSTATSTFSLATSSPPIVYNGIQNLSYIYDAVGNIVEISDTSITSGAHVATFAYDDLYRLTLASTTMVTSTPYTRTYAYDRLGNLTSQTGVGTYLYQGDTGSLYANPHAATTIGGKAVSHDQNGNLTSFASTTNSWDYRNRLLASYASSSPSMFYTYDHTVQRVTVGNGLATTTYPNKYFNKTSATTTKHIFTPNGELLASVESVSSEGASADTGVKTAGTVNTSTGWSNLTTTRLGTSDNSRATCNSTCDNTDNGQVSNFAFGVPAGATINGIEVVAEMSESSSSGNIPTHFSLSWNNGTNYTSTKTATVDGTTDTNYTLGSAADTWGRSWIVSEINSDFRLKIDKATNSDTLNVDHLRVKVFYTTQGNATSTMRYIHVDHLGGTNIVTDSSGVLVQTLDYYPYGDRRINTGTDVSQREFIGEHYDEPTGQSYLNARYYQGSRGQFISQDPIYWNLPTALLLDPQQANSYSYARNNPLQLKDPSGLLTVIVPGTFYNKENWSESRAAGDFIANVENTFGEEPKILSWSGGNSRSARSEGASMLVDLIDNHPFTADEKLNLIGHSHGGNIAIEASHLIDRRIDNLVTLGTPVRQDYKVNEQVIGNHVNAYSYLDPVQVLGGQAFAFGGFGVGIAPLSFGFKPAERTYGSANNLNITAEAGGILGSHSNLVTAPQVWSRIDDIIAP